MTEAGVAFGARRSHPGVVNREIAKQLQRYPPRATTAAQLAVDVSEACQLHHLPITPDD